MPTKPATTDDESQDVFGQPDEFEADLLAAIKQHSTEDEDGVDYAPLDVEAEQRPALTEKDGQALVSDVVREGVKADAKPKEPAAEDETPAAAPKDEKAEGKPAAPADDSALIAAIPEEHRERVSRALENARVAEAIMPLAVARGIPAAQVPGAIETLVKLNDFANTDFLGYVAHVAGMTGNHEGEAAEAFVKGLADKLGVKLAPPADTESEPEDDDDAFADPKVKALEAQLAELKALVAKPPAAAQPAPQPADPAIEERATALRTFATAAGADGRPLRPHFNALAQGGFIARAIADRKSTLGVQDLPHDEATLAVIYRDALLLNPATRDEALRMMSTAATPAPAPQPPSRGKAASTKILDGGHGAPKPAASDDRGLDALLAESIRAARAAA